VVLTRGGGGSALCPTVGVGPWSDRFAALWTLLDRSDPPCVESDGGSDGLGPTLVFNARLRDRWRQRSTHLNGMRGSARVDAAERRTKRRMAWRPVPRESTVTYVTQRLYFERASI
jgi:hypothetical protein